MPKRGLEGQRTVGAKSSHPVGPPQKGCQIPGHTAQPRPSEEGTGAKSTYCLGVETSGIFHC